MCLLYVCDHKFITYPKFICSGIDEVLIEYIVNVLEQLGDDECFDLDEFMEMMAAYIPGFETIKRLLLYLQLLLNYRIKLLCKNTLTCT